MAIGIIHLGWIAWLTKTAPDQAESAGGIQIAVIKLAIMVGASSGGFVFDAVGVEGGFIYSCAVFFLATVSVVCASDKEFN
ncbi:hypothetical protein [Flavobacterium aquicola]|uniref:MFS transporter n=1 Tax=Flavobacterium aquicola TaxID=1682742 RepID=A0A3E0EMT2_9FLAO|nr:hypothetical protein [Flavobacterium aquicola]REG99481.1 hypothetical protein C8P67_10499 [Flavobacterium aquicola]